jgi:hypothetical protein
MANLVGSDIGLNYKGLINLGATVNQNVSGSLQYLTDGDGNNLPIQVSSTATQLNYGVGIGGAPTTAGLHVYGQAGTTGLVFGGASATMYIDLNGTGLNFFDAVETRYRNAGGTNIAMNVWGNLGRVAIGGLATNYTPSAALHVRGDGTNPIFRAENSAGTQFVSVNSTGTILAMGASATNQATFTHSGGQLAIAANTAGTYRLTIVANEYLFLGASAILPQGGVGFNFLTNPQGQTSGTYSSFSISGSYGAASGSANQRALAIGYGINNTGVSTGTATGILLNATETNLNGMINNLMDLQVGGVNRFRIRSVSGGVRVNINGLPTSSAGLSAGDLWNNGGVINIV